MSASQDKKRRTDERALGTERRQVASQKEAKERKQSKIKWTVGSIIVVLLVAAILIGNSSLFYTARPALQVGDVKYSSAEVNYAYRTAYLSFCNQYGSYLTYVKLDTSKPLDEQECGISDEFDTWDDYFRDAAEKNLVQVTALCDAAKKAGVTLDEDDQHEIDEQFSYIELAAKQYKYNSVSKYLQAAYGNGATKKVVRHMLELSQLATKYSQQQYDSYTYTPEEIEASYAKNANAYDTYSYQYYFVKAADTACRKQTVAHNACGGKERRFVGRHQHGDGDGAGGLVDTRPNRTFSSAGLSSTPRRLRQHGSSVSQKYP